MSKPKYSAPINKDQTKESDEKLSKETALGNTPEKKVVSLPDLSFARVKALRPNPLAGGNIS